MLNLPLVFSVNHRVQHCDSILLWGLIFENLYGKQAFWFSVRCVEVDPAGIGFVGLLYAFTQIPADIAQEVTSILMNDEQETLHNWETKQIFVKDKNQTISQYVTETILTLRWFLVNKIIDELKTTITPETEADNSESLSMVVDYLGLTNMFSKKLGRVISRYN